MRQRLGRYANFSALALLFLIVFMAIVITAARLFLPIVADYRHWFEEQLATAVGQPVRIAGMHAHLDGIVPRLYFQHVELLSKDSEEPLLVFPEASLSLDVAGSFIYGKPRLRGLTLAGADLHFLRETDGSVRLLGTYGAPHRDLSQILRWLNNVNLNLYSARLRWEDKKLGLDYMFDRATARFISRGDRHLVFTEFYPEGGLADTMRLAIDFRGDLSQAGSWRGNFYVRVDNLDPRQVPLSRSGIALENGLISTESWGHWENGRVQQATGAINVKDLELAYAGYLSGEGRVSQQYDLRSEFAYEHSDTRDRLQIKDTRAQDGQYALFKDLQLQFDHPEAASAHLVGRIRDANLPALAPLVAQLLRKSVPQAADVSDSVYAGHLDTLEFSANLTDGQPSGLVARGKFHDLGFQHGETLPGAEISGGEFLIGRDGGTFDFDGGRVQFDRPKWYDEPLVVDHLKAHLEWKRRSEGGLLLFVDGLEGGNADAEATGDARAWIGAGDPLLVLNLSLKRFELAKVGRYLPTGKVNPKLDSWFKAALVGGRAQDGRILISGPILHFPFRHSEGQVEAEFGVSDVLLDYKAGWPSVSRMNGQVHFKNGRLDGEFTHAEIFKSTISSAQISLANVFEPLLELKAHSKGPLADALNYLRQAGLIRPENRQLQQLMVDGDADLSLELKQPLSPMVTAKTEVRGTLGVQKALLDFRAMDQRFESVSGDVQFGPEGSRAQGVHAVWRGQSLRLSAAPTPSSGTAVDAYAQLPASTVLQGFKHPLFAAISGNSDWQGRLILPGFGAAHRGEPITLLLASRLKGTNVDLPAPLGKSADEERSVSVSAIFENGRQEPITLRYGNQFAAALETVPGGHGLKRAGFMFGGGEASLPDSGISIMGALSAWSYDQWKPHLWPDRPVSTLTRTEEPSPLKDVDVTVDLADLGGYPLRHVHLKATKIKNRWQAHVIAPSVEGDIDAPLALRHGEQIKASLRRLWIDPSAPDTPSVTAAKESNRHLDPRELPGLELSSANFKYGEHEFFDLKLQTLPVPLGLNIASLQLGAEHFQGKFQGAWIVDKSGPHTDINGSIKSDDLGKALKALRVSHALREGDGSLAFRMSWPGEPYRLSLQSADGSGHVTIKDGSMRHIEPGPGRLLSLINLEGTLRRRLTLNFGDVLSSGFSFDKVDGDLKLNQANLSTKNLAVVAPSADVAIRGRIGLVARDYDQDILITPKLTSGLPILGLVLGGPAVGAVVFVTDKILNELGNGINGLTNIRYTVTGPWDAPVIKGVPAPGF